MMISKLVPRCFEGTQNRFNIVTENFGSAEMLPRDNGEGETL